MAPRKTLTFLGAGGSGKKTLIGNFIWKMRPNMLVVEKLEKNGIKRLDQIQPFAEQNDIELAVDLSPYAYYIVKPSEEPDVLLWVVDANAPDAGEASSKELVASLSNGSLRPKDRLLILINKMDQIEWSEAAFSPLAARFRDLNGLPSKTYIIPVSGFHGGNLVEVPQDAEWMNQNSTVDSDAAGIVLGKCLADLLV
ncbi:citrate synthase [Apiospora arundinis]